jgi:hypothetical protein
MKARARYPRTAGTTGCKDSQRALRVRQLYSQARGSTRSAPRREDPSLVRGWEQERPRVVANIDHLNRPETRPTLPTLILSEPTINLPSPFRLKRPTHIRLPPTPTRSLLNHLSSHHSRPYLHLKLHLLPHSPSLRQTSSPLLPPLKLALHLPLLPTKPSLLILPSPPSATLAPPHSTTTSSTRCLRPASISTIRVFSTGPLANSTLIPILLSRPSSHRPRSSPLRRQPTLLPVQPRPSPTGWRPLRPIPLRPFPLRRTRPQPLPKISPPSTRRCIRRRTTRSYLGGMNRPCERVPHAVQVRSCSEPTQLRRTFRCVLYFSFSDPAQSLLMRPLLPFSKIAEVWEKIQQLPYSSFLDDSALDVSCLLPLSLTRPHTDNHLFLPRVHSRCARR